MTLFRRACTLPLLVQKTAARLSHQFRFRLGVATLVFAYLVYVRTRGISQSFCLLGDQILYWRMAMGPWSDLPLGGGPTSVGGTTLGPVFCWVVWLIGKAVGPMTGYLPHAGGIGLSLIQSAADAFILLAVWRRFRSFVFALAVTLLAATSPFDMSLSATIWNPPLAVAFVKSSIACALWRRGEDGWSLDVACVILAWLAVQAHSSAIFFACCLGAGLVVREFLMGGWRSAAVCTLTLGGVPVRAADALPIGKAAAANSNDESASRS